MESLLHCSFCEKPQDQVAKLIAGPGVYICNHCVDLCNDIIDDERVGEVTLSLLAELSRRLDGYVDVLRQQGVPWDEIAAALRPPEEE